MATLHNGGGSGSKHVVAPMEVSVEAGNAGAEAWLDDDGRPRRTGTFWTASARIITAVFGSRLLSLAWPMAQLGWVAGPAVMLLLAFVNYYTSTLLAECYRSEDPATGERNHTYIDAVHSNLGAAKVTFCSAIQYANLVRATIGYTITSSISMRAIRRFNCFHGHKDPYISSSNPYMIIFGAVQIVFSQIPDFGQIWWFSIIAAVMSFTYSSIGLSLSIAKIITNGEFQGSLTGISIGADVTSTQKVWRSLQAFGDIAFAYSFSNIFIEIQDTIKAPPPSEANVMKKATLVSVAATTVFYMLCGCMGYAAFGDNAPDNLLMGFGFCKPFWLLNIANVAIVVQLVGGYQVFCQPIFAFVEGWASASWSDSAFVSRKLRVGPFALSVFRLTWRSAFVCLITVVAMLPPFIGNVVGHLGFISFWPLTVYFPVEMYIAQHRVPRGSTRWICLQTLSVVCLLVSIAAAAGSIAGVVDAPKVYRSSSG